MNKPKMILFDAGRTLLDYVSVDTRKGVHALMPYITSNPHNRSEEDIDYQTNQIFSHFDESRKQLYEVPEQTILKLVYDLLELEFSISLQEVEQIIWMSDAEKVAAPYAAEVLEQLHQMGIQTGVISNLDFSSDLLRSALNDLYPNNHFQFVLTSSDYGIRKPNGFLFQAGIVKSGFSAQDIWYVGDKIPVDVEGSRNAGMIPVLYQCPRNHYGKIPDDILVIQDFRELLDLIHAAEV